MKSIRSTMIDLAKKHPWLRVAFRHFQLFFGRIRFKRYNVRGIDDNLVLFESYLGRSYAGSPRAIYEAMLRDERFADYRFIWFFKDPQQAAGFPALSAQRTTIIKYRSTRYYEAYGRAKYWISNSIIPEELTPNDQQIYLQTWHGTPLKRIGLDVIDETQNALSGKREIVKKYTAEGDKVSLFLSSSAFTDEAFATAFALPTAGKRRPLAQVGNPRNDALHQPSASTVEEIKARLGLPAGKKAVLYAPTWREDQHDSHSGYVYHSPVDFEMLRNELGGDYVILFRAHYLVSNSFDFEQYAGFVFDVSDWHEINELYLISDALITDYSSSFFDYALLDRPILFFMYDLEHYASALRGFYLSLDELPGPVIRTQHDLVATLTDLDRVQAAYRQARLELNKRMNPHDDGNVSKRTLDLLLSDTKR